MILFEDDFEEFTDVGHVDQGLYVVVLEDELARVDGFDAPLAEGGSLFIGEGDFDDFEFHEMEDGPDIPTFGGAFKAVFGDLP